MRNVIIWHWFIKNLVGTWRPNDVDATSLRRIEVITTSCACWEFAPPPLAPQYSKPNGPPNILNLPTHMKHVGLARPASPFLCCFWSRLTGVSFCPYVEQFDTCTIFYLLFCHSVKKWALVRVQQANYKFSSRVCSHPIRHFDICYMYIAASESCSYDEWDLTTFAKAHIYLNLPCLRKH